MNKRSEIRKMMERIMNKEKWKKEKWKKEKWEKKSERKKKTNKRINKWLYDAGISYHSCPEQGKVQRLVKYPSSVETDLLMRGGCAVCFPCIVRKVVTVDWWIDDGRRPLDSFDLFCMIHDSDLFCRHLCQHCYRFDKAKLRIQNKHQYLEFPLLSVYQSASLSSVPPTKN